MTILAVSHLPARAWTNLLGLLLSYFGAQRGAKVVVFLCALMVSVLFLGCQRASEPVGSSPPIALRGVTMGTTYSIKCWRAAGKLEAKPLQQAVDVLLKKINRQMSTYLPDSELSRFNRAPAGDWFPVSPETAFVVAQAKKFHKLTDGASDVTVGPLVRLWHFGPKSGENQTEVQEPTQAALRAALQRVGCEYLQVRSDPPALKKTRDGLEVDLSSIAKGYAVDAVTELLAGRGIPHSMVEIGGEVRAAGTRPDGKPWRIGVESPQVETRTVQRVVPLRDSALATSGDYRIFHRAGGGAYCHIINPRSGEPLPYRGVAATVLADTCLAADAMATALLVMGSEKGYDWCVQHEVAALFLARGEQGVQARATPLFQRRIK